MSQINELHEQAMDLTDAALVAQREGDQNSANELTHQAFELESAAANLLKDDIAAEPTRSVLYRSAASLADELRDLLDQVSRRPQDHSYVGTRDVGQLNVALEQKPQFSQVDKPMSDASGRTHEGEFLVRNKVFISYSQADEEFFRPLAAYLKPLEQKGAIEFWNDMEIKARASWREEVEKSLNVAKVVIFFVSPSFPPSDFLHELAPLLRTAQKDGTSVISVTVRPGMPPETMSQFSTIYSTNEPLALMSKKKREEVLGTVARTATSALFSIV
jgi:hypothetical protein